MRIKGVARKVDELGRITIPSEYRRMLKINNNDTMNIHIEGKGLVLLPVMIECQLCCNTEDLISISDYVICSECFKTFKDYFN